MHALTYAPSESNFYGDLALHVVWDLEDGRLEEAVESLHHAVPTFRALQCALPTEMRQNAPVVSNFTSVFGLEGVESGELPPLTPETQVLVCYLRYRLFVTLEELGQLHLYRSSPGGSSEHLRTALHVPSDAYLTHHSARIVPVRMKMFG